MVVVVVVGGCGRSVGLEGGMVVVAEWFRVGGRGEVAGDCC